MQNSFTLEQEEQLSQLAAVREGVGHADRGELIDYAGVRHWIQQQEQS